MIADAANARGSGGAEQRAGWVVVSRSNSRPLSPNSTPRAAMDNTHRHAGPGSYGFLLEYAAGVSIRTRRSPKSVKGTSEVQRMLIARDLRLPVPDLPKFA